MPDAGHPNRANSRPLTRAAFLFVQFCAPLIWINSLTSEEQTVPVTPLMRCHEVFIDLRPPPHRRPHF
jgi:hypothetical protein